MTTLTKNIVFHFLSELTNGGVQGPIEGYNSFADASTAASSYSSNVGGGSRWGEPYFDSMTPKNVTALVGKSAYLSCRVRNLGNKTVSMDFFYFSHIFIFLCDFYLNLNCQ